MKTYRVKPLTYRQWGAIRKEIYKLVFVVAGIFLFNVAAYAACYIVFNGVPDMPGSVTFRD